MEEEHFPIERERGGGVHALPPPLLQNTLTRGNPARENKPPPQNYEI